MSERASPTQVDQLFVAVQAEIESIRGHIANVAEQLPSLPDLLTAVESRAPRSTAEGPLYQKFFGLIRSLEAAGILMESDSPELEKARKEALDRILNLINWGFGSELELVRGPELDLGWIYKRVADSIKNGWWSQPFEDLTQDERSTSEGRKSAGERSLARLLETWRLATFIADHVSVFPEHFKRGSRYFVAGRPGEMQHLSEHFNFHSDALELINHARERVDCILIGDEAGILHGLRRDHHPSPLEGYKNWFYSLDEREVSKSIGFHMQLFLKAAQQEAITRREFFEEYLLDYDEEPYFKNEYKPVLRMSEVLKPGKDKIVQIAEFLFKRLAFDSETQRPADDTLAKLLWKCIPVHIRIAQFGESLGRKKYRDFCKTVEKLESETDLQIWAAFKQMMAYGLYQTATTLYLGGTKVGFEGEREFDEVARHCLEHYADELDLDEISRGLNFVHLATPEGLANLPAPYVPYPFGKAKRSTFSIHQAFESEAKMGDTLKGFIEKKLPVYVHALMNIERNLYFSEESYDIRARDCMLDVEIFKLLRDLVAELKRQGELHKALKSSGISDVLALESYTLLRNLRKVSLTSPFQPDPLDPKVAQAFEQARLIRRSEFKAFIETYTPEEIKYYTKKRIGRLQIDDIDLGDLGGRGLHEFKLKEGEFASFYLMRYLAQVLSGPLQNFPDLIGPIQNILGTLAEVMYPGGSGYIDLRPRPEGRKVVA